MKIGPTKDFPRGKLNKDDEGGLKIAIHQEGDVVRIDFGKKIAWIGLPPTEAITFANIITSHAMEIKSRQR
jgi:hypothetical protein